ncbi:MAG: PDZ domain-containing protein [Alphaproteobacteria bacterium]|nr:MAG: PDZ domain-containing protein [Alphaproteobacteria bacterium]
MKRLFVVSVLLLGLAACAAPTMTGPGASIDRGLIDAERQKQYELAVEENLKQYERLNRVGFPILRANADWCGRDGRTRPSIGALIAGTAHMKEPTKAALKRVLEMNNDGAVITGVPSGTPAAEAGLRRGDQIVSLNGQTVSAQTNSAELLDDMKKAADDSFAHKKPLTLAINRDGKSITKSVSPVLACDFYVAIDNKDVINAFADGKGIVFTKGMMRFANEDDELAVVMGHELGHNLNHHIDSKKTNAAGGLLLDILAAAGGVNTQGMFSGLAASAYSQDFEREADYVGLYLTARGGYDIEDAPNFWRRMAIESPASIKDSHTSSHPATPERFLALESTVKEIESKLSSKRKLEPDKNLRF